jgi:hypothetical protein
MAARRQEAHIFTAEHRDHVRARVLGLVRTDPGVTAGALTGCTAVGVVHDAYNVAGEKRAAVGGAAGGGLLLFVVFV